MAEDAVRADDRPCVMTRTDTGIITHVDASITSVLGWRPADLVGTPSTRLIHPEDQPAAVAAWFDMLASAGGRSEWEGRWQTADGGWRWLQVTNRNELGDPADPRVVSTLTPAAERIDLREELRSREQLLSRLADALPVGLVQFDTAGEVVFTNERLHALLEVAPQATVLGQLGSTCLETSALEGAIRAVLGNEAVDRLELRFRVSAEGASSAATRICELTLRPLTDDHGSVTGAIGCLTDVTDSVVLRHDLQHRASTDPLTGCLNRAATLTRLEGVVASTRPGNGTLVAYVDVNEFKHINDTHGHAVGDLVLTAVVRQLRDVLRDNDDIGRVGGDELVVVCPGVSTLTAVRAITSRLRRAAQGQVAAANGAVPWTASVGTAWSDVATTAEQLIERADAQMYANKHRMARARARALRIPVPRQQQPATALPR